MERPPTLSGVEGREDSTDQEENPNVGIVPPPSEGGESEEAYRSRLATLPRIRIDDAYERVLDQLREDAWCELAEADGLAARLGLRREWTAAGLVLRTCPSCGASGPILAPAYLDPEEPDWDAGEAEPRWPLVRALHERADSPCDAQAIAAALDTGELHRAASDEALEVEYQARLHEWADGMAGAPPELPETPDSDEQDPDGLLSILDLAARPEPAWLVEGIIPGGPRLLVLSGPAGTGKSYLALGLALAGAAGREWIGHEVSPLRTLYLPLEGDYEVAPRAEAWTRHHGLELADVADAVKVMDASRLSSDADITRLQRVIRRHRADLVIVDAWRQALGGKSDSDEDSVSTLLQRLRAVAKATGATILVLHNTGWDSSRERGSTYLRDDVDLAMRAARIDADSFHLVCDKARLAPPFERIGVVLLDSGGRAVAERFQAAEVSEASAETRRRKAILEALATAPEGLLVSELRGPGFGKTSDLEPTLEAMRAERLIVGGEKRGERVRTLL